MTSAATSAEVTSSSSSTPKKPTFADKPFTCRVSFTRAQNPSAPTVVSPRTNLVKGDLFAISLNNDDTQKLVMQVDRVEDERQMQSANPEIIFDESIKKTFSVDSFKMNSYTVQKIENEQVFALYLVEVQVKEQYFSRGDMWRFTRKLVNTTAYLKKTLDIFGMRATVYGLWISEHPYRVSSGYITQDTKIVFRSLSAFCTIFLQMAKEMWDFDHKGDTYYEKAVDGFLFDLFTRWRLMSCQHDVTMTLFSRVFYDAKSLEDFPASLRQDINTDHRGRFFEDFYCVIYQNERYDDWRPRLAKIKEVLVNYKEDLVTYHKKQLSKAEADKMPDGRISSAADGNFLETLNLSSSVFERHFIDRSFDRLGQMSLLITPGAGVFEVDRELMNMTKQRVLDNGIGSDLVCLGEQPLFAVPLFKFFKGDPYTADDYQIPHWINLSYYRGSAAPSCFTQFGPRLSFDRNRIKKEMLNVKNVMNSITDEYLIKPTDPYMEEYDAQIFKTSTRGSTESTHNTVNIARGEGQVVRRRNITMGPSQPAVIEEDDGVQERAGMMIANRKPSTLAGFNDDPPQYNANIKDDIALSTSHTTSTNLSGLQSYSTLNASSQVLFCSTQSFTRIAQSADTYFLTSQLFARLQARPKALTNPFAPATLRIRMDPGRRRWAHTFPIGPDKIPWHFHHLREMEGAKKREVLVSIATCAHLVLPGTSKRLVDGFKPKRANQHAKTSSDTKSRSKRIVSPSNFDVRREALDRKGSITDDNRATATSSTGKKANSNTSRKALTPSKHSQAIIWGPTGKEPWSALMITSIDWKSLTIPASLPTTFDVAPSAEDLRHDYTHNSYELIRILPSWAEYDQRKRHAHSGSGNQEGLVHSDVMERHRVVFDELIDQRLSQGFQIIIQIPTDIEKIMIQKIRVGGYKETKYNRLLNIGRIYHTLSLVTEHNPKQDMVIISVQQFKPQNFHQPKLVPYKYRFKCPDSSYYDPARSTLQLENLEQFAWNIVDNIVCSHGVGVYDLTDRNEISQQQLINVDEKQNVIWTDRYQRWIREADADVRFMCPIVTKPECISVFLQAMKYWRTRLVLMPVSRDYTIKNIESGQTKCDSRQEMSHEDYFLSVEHFIRFLFILNKLSHIRTGPNEFLHRPIDPITNTKRHDGQKRQGKNTLPKKTFQLSAVMSRDTEAMNALLTLFHDEQQGLPFVKDAVLPEHSFIAIEAIWWCIEHCDEIQDEHAALSFFQLLFERQLIRHCTHTVKSFRFGFFLYFLVTEKTERFCLDSNDYAEVEFYRTQTFIPSIDYLGFGTCEPMRLLPKIVQRQQPAPRPARLRGSTTSENAPSLSSSATFEESAPSERDILSTESKRSCNVDVDPKRISDRREWAVAHHHALYNPHCLFELEIRWLVVTACILGELITTWSQRTATILSSNQVAFHLIPIPCDPFAEFDPLRGPIYIRMDSSCLLGKLVDLPEKDQVLRLNSFQELILKRYGFILNTCVSYINENIYYVHISGGMLVYILSDVYNFHCNRRSIRVASSKSADDQQARLECGFYWCWNFCLGKKWRSLQTGEEKYQDIMLADFRAFCANENNRLLNFWNEVDETAKREMAQLDQSQGE